MVNLKENYPQLGIMQSREFHNSKEIHCSCTLKFLLQRQQRVSASTTEERQVFHHWFRQRESNFDEWKRLISFLHQNCLFVASMLLLGQKLLLRILLQLGGVWKSIVKDWNGDGEGLNFQLIANCLLINAVPSTTYFVLPRNLITLH